MNLSSLNKSTRSIRARITVGLTFFVMAILAGASVSVWTRENSLAEQRTAEALNIAAIRAEDEWEEEEHLPGYTLLHTVKAHESEIAAGGLELVVVDRRRRVLWKSAPDAPSWPHAGDDWRVTTMSREGQTLVLGQRWGHLQADLNALAKALALINLLAIVATAAGAWFAVGRTLSPIDGLTAQADTASTVNLHVRLEAPSPDAEIIRLTDTINALLNRLGQEAKVQSRFYAAASHELRTPLQALLGHLDVALSRERSVEEYKTALREAQEQTERLTRLIQDLLQLNALETGASHPASETVNAGDIAERTIRQFSSRIQERHLQVELKLPDLVVSTPSTHLEIVARNLIENAVKYTPEGGHLAVEVQETRATAPSWRMSIWNECETPASDLNLWLEPFFRPDASRYSATGGNGLGLAIVKAVCQANGWGLVLSNEQGAIVVTVSGSL